MIRQMLANLVFALIFWAAVPASAVIVFQKNSDEPIRGFLITENDTHIVVEELLPSGERQEHVLPNVAIEDIIRAVDVERLAALRPKQPAEYRNYAEDLAVKTEDPEARVAALQLYLIAAHLSPQELGRSCLLGMAALARTPEEERAFRAMAFVLDPDHDPSLLKPPKLVARSFVSIKPTQRSALRRAVQLLRSGQLTEARNMFRRPPVQAAKAFYSHILNNEDYERAIAAEGGLPDKLLRKFIKLEITLSTSSVSDNAEADREFTPWSKVLSLEDTTPISSLALRTITEFDPRASVYRNRKWVIPD
jgi:hypothetical protein